MNGPAFSLVMPYHNNPEMWQRQLDNYLGFPPEIARGLEIVICDDASNDAERARYSPAHDFPEDMYPRVSIFRIPPPHVPWSHRVATNIAAANARGKWLLVTDIDHVVPLRTWRYLMDPGRPKLATNRAYRFERINADGSTYKPHPDSWLFHVSLWNHIGGYDERYRGHYGQNMPFIERVERYTRIETLPISLIRYSRDDIPDASERVLTRKSPEARAAIARLRAQFTANRTFLADTRGQVCYEKVRP